MFLKVFGEQSLFHAVEGSDAFLLAARRLLAGKTHHQEGEAVAGHSIFCACLAFSIKTFDQSKIGGVKLWAAIKVANGAKHMPCCLPKCPAT